MYICIDFDGTIVDHRYPDIGEPVPGAIEWMKRWQQAGAKLILFTMRSGKGLEEAVRWLTWHEIELHGINHNPNQASWSTSPKAYGHLYIDDAAFGCPLLEVKRFARDCVNFGIVGPAVLKRIERWYEVRGENYQGQRSISTARSPASPDHQRHLEGDDND